MNKQIIFFILLFTCRNCIAQNLVPNGNFEGYRSCPTDISQLDTALYWITPTTGTSDYFNQCTTNASIDVPNNQVGFQTAYSGVGYSGIFLFDIFFNVSLNYREYLEVPLTSVSMASTSCGHYKD